MLTGLLEPEIQEGRGGQNVGDVETAEVGALEGVQEDLLFLLHLDHLLLDLPRPGRVFQLDPPVHVHLSF